MASWSLASSACGKSVSPAQFSLFRMLLGVVLAAFFFQQWPRAADFLVDRDIGFAPTAALAHGIFFGLMLVSVAFAMGLWRRVMATVLGVCWVILYHGVDFRRAPSPWYLAAVLLLCALVPSGEPWSVSRARLAPTQWVFPRWVFLTAWIVLAAGYTSDAVLKLGKESWIHGNALQIFLESTCARWSFTRDILAALPSGLLRFLTWSALAFELTFLLLSLNRTTRLAAWAIMLVMQVGAFSVLGSGSAFFGVLVMHLFTFDPDWFPPRRDSRRPVLLYDGQCGLCNAVVRFLLREDLTARMRFAPLQSIPAQQFLGSAGLPTADFDSLVYVPDWEGARTDSPLFRTSGALAVLDEIGGAWRVVSWLRIIPAFLRDPLYRLVAKTRYALFGTYRARPLADPAWDARFVAR